MGARSAVATLGLVAAVPLTTGLAAATFRKHAPEGSTRSHLRDKVPIDAAHENP